VETILTKEIKYKLLEHYRTKRDMHVAQECGNMDVLAISKEGISYEFEVKISKSDLVADKKKSKHRKGMKAHTHFFYYVVTQELSETALLQANKLNDTYGVMTYNGIGFDILKRAKKRKCSTNLENLLYGHISYAYVKNYKKVCLYETDRELFIPHGVSKKAETVYRNLLKTYSVDTVELFLYNVDKDVITYNNHTIVFKEKFCYVALKQVHYKKVYGDSWIETVLQGVDKWINEAKKDIVFTM